ncbi:MAG TPA: hypothetical protein VG096_19700 [Bryobacteraceae bacterium]|jgi:hypothetical protein|nr:hypothetical protein [Bryobacteraceae bacterium]
MASSLELQQLRLRTFVAQRLTPATEQFTKMLSSSDFLYRLARGEALEAIWWLHLGTELQYFPSSEAWTVFQPFSEIIDRDLHSHLGEYESSYSPRLRLWLLSALKQKDGFPVLDKFEVPLAWHNVFTNALMLSDYSFRDKVAQAFLSSVAVLDRLRWESTRDAIFSPEALRFLLQFDSHSYPDVSPELLYAGFFRSLEHIRAWQQFFAELAIKHADLPQDRGHLRDRIAQIQVWRLNLRDDLVEERMQEMARAAQQLIVNEAAEGPTNLDRAKIPELQKRIKELVDDWRRLHSFYLSQTGGA